MDKIVLIHLLLVQLTNFVSSGATLKHITLLALLASGTVSLVMTLIDG